MGTRRLRSVGALVLTGALGTWAAVPALASRPTQLAPTYVRSEPANGAKLDDAPDEVSATFSEPLDDSSAMIVLDACDRRIDDRNVVVDLNTMSVGIAEKPSGTYQVLYRAVGFEGATGARQGGFRFEVTSGPSCHRLAGHTGEQAEHPRHGGGGETGAGTHGGHDAGAGTHAATATDHGATAHSDEGHLAAAGGPGSHARHRGRGPATEQDGARTLARERPVAAGGATEALADLSAVAAALALAAAIGAVGGWILREMSE